MRAHGYRHIVSSPSRMLAAILCVAFTLTSATGAWASFTYASVLRGGLEGTVQGGLEEALDRPSGSGPSARVVASGEAARWIARLARATRDPQGPRQAPGKSYWDLRRLFGDYDKEGLSGAQGVWAQILAGLLRPGDAEVQQQLRGEGGDPVCPACANFSVPKQGGQAANLDEGEAAFNAALMRALRAIEGGPVHPPSPTGAASHDLSEVQRLGKWQGKDSHGVVLGGVDVVQQAVALLQGGQGAITAVTMAVQRDEGGRPMSHFVTLIRGPEGALYLQDLDRLIPVAVAGGIPTAPDAQGAVMNVAGLLSRPNPTVLVWTSLSQEALRGRLPREARLAMDKELAQVVGCCGVVGFASPISDEELYALGWRARPAFSLLEAAKESIKNLEPRGFDSSGVLVKYEIPFRDLLGELPLVTNRLRTWARSNQVELVMDEAGRLKGVRFFAVGRITGAATVNWDFIMNQIEGRVQALVPELLRELGIQDFALEREGVGSDDRLVTTERSGVRSIIARVALRGVWIHTRFATKGGYDETNAHHWIVAFEGGVWTLSHNGDWETFDWVRPYFQWVLGEQFEGDTDSETLLRLLVRMAVTRRDGGVQIALPEVAIARLFRLIDVLEVVKAVGLQLKAIEDEPLKIERERDDGKLTGEQVGERLATLADMKRDAEALKELLQGFGFDANHLLPTETRGPVKVSKTFLDVLESALEDPAYYDRQGTKDNGWQGYLAFMEHDGVPLDMLDGKPVAVGLGTYLAAAAPPRFRGIFEKGLNITMQVGSLNDPYGMVIARTYAKSTAGYLAVGRNRKGEIDRVTTASELKGPAPQMGRALGRAEVAPGIFVVSGEVEGMDLRPWHIYTFDGLKVYPHPVWQAAGAGLEEAVALDLDRAVKPIQASWVYTSPRGEETRRRLSTPEIEAMVVSRTISETVGRYTMRRHGLWTPDVERRKDEEDDETGLTPEAMRRLGLSATRLQGSGSGSSTFTLLIAEERDGFDMTIRSSDQSRMAPQPLLFDERTVLIIVSQSGETGAAINLANQVIAKGGLVIVVTNTRGSTLYRIGERSGGVLLERSTPEYSVAATGTVIHQINLLRLLGIEVLRRREKLSPEEVDARVRLIRDHGTRTVDGQEIPGTLKGVLDEYFNPDVAERPGSFRNMGQRVVEFIRGWSQKMHTPDRPGYGDDYRAVRVTLIGRAATGVAAMLELCLKLAEQIGIPGQTMRASQFMEGDIGSHNGAVNEQHVPLRPAWDHSTVVQTIRANREQHRTLDGLTLTDQPIRRILLVGNGGDLTPMQGVAALYEQVTVADVEVLTYDEALTKGYGRYVPPEDTLVIFVRPAEVAVSADGRDDLATPLLERWRIPPARQISVCSPTPSGPAAALRPSLSNVLELRGEAQDQTFAVWTVLDRLLSLLALRFLEQDGRRPTQWHEDARKVVARIQQAHDAAVEWGIQQTIGSIGQAGAYNQGAFDRFVGFAQARGGTRGWEEFNFWPEGYGVREILARDFAWVLREVLGVSSYSEQPSNGSHGLAGAMHPGGEAVWWYLPVGPEEGAAYGEDYWKQVDQVVPRAVMRPFPGDREPGFLMMIGTQEQQRDYDLDDNDYRGHRRGRHLGGRGKRSDGAEIATRHPDAVLATPNGDLFEVLVLNRVVADHLARARASALAQVGIPWEAPEGEQQIRRGDLVINADPGDAAADRELYYRTLRERFPKGQGLIVTVVPRTTEDYVYQNSDLVFDLPTGGPAEMMSFVHGLSLLIAKARYEKLAQRAAIVARAIDEELNAADRGVFGQHDDLKTPRFVGRATIIKLFAQYGGREGDLTLSHQDQAIAHQVTQAIASFESKHGIAGEVRSLLEDALQIYRVQLVPVFGFAHDPDLLIKYLVFQIQGLAKVVTNLGGVMIRSEYRRDDPGITMTTLGDLADGTVDDGVIINGLVTAMRENSMIRHALSWRFPTLPDGSVARRYWSVTKPAWRRFADRWVQQDATLRGIPVTLGAGYSTAGATDPESGGMVLDLMLADSPALMAQVMEDELRHLQYQPDVEAMAVDSVTISGLPSDMEGRETMLVRQAIAESVFLLGQAGRFAALAPDEQQRVSDTLGGNTPFLATATYHALLVSEGGADHFSAERFWRAMKVIADTPAYGEVSFVAGKLLSQQDRVGADVWRAAGPLVQAVAAEVASQSQGDGSQAAVSLGQPSDVAQAGMEEVQEGVDYRLDDDDNAVFLKSVEVHRPNKLPNGVTLNPQGGSIVIGSGTTLFPAAKLKGSIVIARDVEAGEILLGTTEEPLVVGERSRIHRAANVKRSIVGPQTHINGAEVSGSTVVPFVRDGVVAPAEVQANSSVLNGSVVFGGAVGTGIKVYDHHVVGPFVRIGNNSEHDAGFFWGVAEGAPIAFPHHGYSETMWAVPAAVEGAERFTPAYYDRLKQIMRAIMFGTLVKIELAEAAPVSSSGARFTATFDVDGEEVSFPAQRINFGANTITSDYDSSTGARASGSVMAGAATGVGSVLKFPALVEPRALIGNLTQAEGVTSQGTLLYGTPAGIVTGPAKDRVTPVEIPGYRAPGRGFALPGGVSEEIQVQVDYFRRLAIAADVLTEAARRAADPFTLAGYAASVRAIHGAFGGIGPRYSKLVGAVGLSLETLKAETDPERRARLESRISEQEALLQKKDAILAEINQIGEAIRAAVDSVAAVTQPAVAEWVRQQVLHPETVWTNPLAAGMEEFATAVRREEQKFLIVAPEGLPALDALGLVRSEHGALFDAVPVIALVETDAQAAGAQAQLKALGVEPGRASEWIVRLAPGQSVGDVVDEIRRRWEGWHPLVVENVTDATLELLAGFLGIPIPRVAEFVKQAGLEAAEALARYYH